MFFVFWDSYVLCIYVMNILCTFHIYMYGYVTAILKALQMRLKISPQLAEISDIYFEEKYYNDKRVIQHM